MNTTSPAKPLNKDLILQLVGGKRDGKLLPVRTAKCLLSSLIQDKSEAERYRCAIFRGSKGVAFRSYNQHVLVNGAQVSVQWLKAGDVISLTPTLTVQIKDLGFMESAPAPAPKPAPVELRDPAQTICVDPTDLLNDFKTAISTSPEAPGASTASPVTKSTGDVNNPTAAPLSTPAETTVQTPSVVAESTAASESNAGSPDPMSSPELSSASAAIQDFLSKSLSSTETSSPETLASEEPRSFDTTANEESSTETTRGTHKEIERLLQTASTLPTADETESTSEVSQSDATEKQPESVADVLARMQSAGSLANFDLNAEEEDHEQATSPTASVAPTPIAQSVSQPEEPSNSMSGDEDSSVEDYMSQLLNRMRGDADSEAEEETAKASQPVKKESPVTSPVVKDEAAAEAIVAPLTEDEFRPKEKAFRMQSFNSLREIANNNARLAIQDHIASQRKVSTQTKLQLSLISLFFSIACFSLSCIFSPKIIAGGMFFGLGFLLVGVFMAYLYREENALDQSLSDAELSDKLN